MESIHIEIKHLDSSTVKVLWYFDLLKYVTEFTLTLEEIMTINSTIIKTVSPSKTQTHSSYTFDQLTRGKNYQVYMKWKIFGEERFISRKFRAHYGLHEMQILLDKARAYITNHSMRKIQWFYRNKPPDYYLPIQQSFLKVEKAYQKDMNGDKACPINHEINGLFFNGRTQFGLQPEAASPFGSVRFHILAEKLFTPINNLYFADFYCTRTQHYVTVVLAHLGTEADRFCSKNLLPLDKFNNEFLSMDFMGNVSMNHSSLVRVEVFSAEDINTTEGYFTFNNPTMGIGRSKPDGLPKNTQCSICNIYPEPSYGIPNSCISHHTNRTELKNLLALLKGIDRK